MTKNHNIPMPIKVGILLAYDAGLSLTCIQQIYSNADQVTLCIDKKRQTWAGEHYELPHNFLEQIKQIDVSNKIKIYEDSFFLPGLEPMECDTRQRRLLAEQMGKGGWHIQVDADEYFVDFPGFVAELRAIELKHRDKPVMVFLRWATLFKKDISGYFVVSPFDETFPAATNRPNYICARVCNHKEYRIINSSQLVLHQSWARSRNEIEAKMANWSHNNDFDRDSYLRFWDSVNIENFRYISDFHPVHKKTWKALIHLQGSLFDIIEDLRSQKVVLANPGIINRACKGMLYLLNLFAAAKHIPKIMLQAIQERR